MFKSRGDIVYKCTVRLLEDTEILECEFHPSYKGKFLLEYVCQQLNLTETDYFGLRYVDASGQRHWLHMAKLILKQVKDSTPILFSFRVKFYPPNPLLLKEDVTRFQIYLQLKRDLLHGRLYCTANEAAMLGALIIQIELGDYDPSIHVGNYVTEMRLLLRQTDIIEARIQELHREPVEGAAAGGGVQGMSTQEAERSFLKIACQLDTYGVDPHPVKLADHRGSQLYLGINHSGILTFQGSRKTHHFKWSEVHKINFEGRMFIVHLNYPEKKHTVGFKCPSGAACRHVWCCAIEQMLFFTLPSSSDACVYSGGGLFSWGTKFKYFGRTEREILERDGLLTPRDSQEEGSSTGGKRKASSVPATPSTPMTGDFVGYSSLPRSAHSAPLDEADACNGGCLLAGPAVDIALACCDKPERTSLSLSHSNTPHLGLHAIPELTSNHLTTNHTATVHNTRKMGDINEDGEAEDLSVPDDTGDPEVHIPSNLDRTNRLDGRRHVTSPVVTFRRDPAEYGPSCSGMVPEDVVTPRHVITTYWDASTQTMHRIVTPVKAPIRSAIYGPLHSSPDLLETLRDLESPPPPYRPKSVSERDSVIISRVSSPPPRYDDIDHDIDHNRNSASVLTRRNSIWSRMVPFYRSKSNRNDNTEAVTSDDDTEDLNNAGFATTSPTQKTKGWFNRLTNYYRNSLEHISPRIIVENTDTADAEANPNNDEMTRERASEQTSNMPQNSQENYDEILEDPIDEVREYIKASKDPMMRELERRNRKKRRKEESGMSDSEAESAFNSPRLSRNRKNARYARHAQPMSNGSSPHAKPERMAYITIVKIIMYILD